MMVLHGGASRQTACFLAVLLSLAVAPPAIAQQDDGPVYVAYYWRAKPGQVEAYNTYIKTIAERIDENARQAGVFESVITVTPSQMGASAAVTDWTHLRVFALKNRAAAEALGTGLDEATRRVVPDEAQRKANSERSASLRDFVRQEVWRGLQ